MKNDILEYRMAVVNNIAKSFGYESSSDLLDKSEENEFEKAKHQDGDIHPNGKWVWRQSANGGKGDWRVVSPSKRSGGSSKTTSTKTTASKTNSSDSKKKVPSGKKVSFDDDIVAVYDDKGKKVYQGMLDYSPYRLDDSKWNEKDKNYDLPKGYKMVGE